MAATGGGIAMRDGVIAQNPASGRFMGSGSGLSVKQAAFVSAYVANGGNGQQAASAAGYSDPRTDSWRLLRNRAVIGAIQETATVMITAGGVVGVGVLMEVARDKAAPPAARVSAAKWLAEAAGHGLAVRKAGEDQGEDVPLEQRTLGELEQMATDLAAQLAAARTTVIEAVAHNVAHNAGQEGADS